MSFFKKGADQLKQIDEISEKYKALHEQTGKAFVNEYMNEIRAVKGLPPLPVDNYDDYLKDMNFEKTSNTLTSKK